MNKFEIRSKYLTNEEIDILAELEDSCQLKITNSLKRTFVVEGMRI